METFFEGQKLFLYERGLTAKCKELEFSTQSNQNMKTTHDFHFIGIKSSKNIGTSGTCTLTSVILLI